MRCATGDEEPDASQSIKPPLRSTEEAPNEIPLEDPRRESVRSGARIGTRQARVLRSRRPSCRRKPSPSRPAPRGKRACGSSRPLRARPSTGRGCPPPPAWRRLLAASSAQRAAARPRDLALRGRRSRRACCASAPAWHRARARVHARRRLRARGRASGRRMSQHRGHVRGGHARCGRAHGGRGRASGRCTRRHRARAHDLARRQLPRPLPFSRDRNRRRRRAMTCRQRRGRRPLPHLERLCGVDQIELIKHNRVSKHELLERLVRWRARLCLFFHLAQPAENVLGITQCHYARQREAGRDGGRLKQRTHDGHGVRHARRLDEHRIQRLPLVHRLEDGGEGAEDVATNRAAHASVVHDDDLLGRSELGCGEKLVVDGNLTELVFDDGDFLLALRVKQVVEQGRLAGAEEASQHCDGDLAICPSPGRSRQRVVRVGVRRSVGGRW
eukprot:scaffold189716_cov28-Tisochrysis_lutea.AAC.2